jgi:hypothetical protein
MQIRQPEKTENDRDILRIDEPLATLGEIGKKAVCQKATNFYYPRVPPAALCGLRRRAERRHTDPNQKSAVYHPQPTVIAIFRAPLDGSRSAPCFHYPLDVHCPDSALNFWTRLMPEFCMIYVLNVRVCSKAETNPIND